MHFNLDFYMCICHTFKYHVHILFFLNSVSKPYKMDGGDERISMYKGYMTSKIEDHLKDIIVSYT
jgi:hypothetical protein